MNIKQLIEGKNTHDAIKRKSYLLFHLMNSDNCNYLYIDDKGETHGLNNEAVVQILNISKNIPDWMLNIYHMMTFQDEDKKLRFYGPGSKMEFNRLLLQGEMFYNEEEKEVWISLQKE